MNLTPTKYQYQQDTITTPDELHALGFRFTCWKIVDLYNNGKTVWRVNCLNKLDGSTATKWFDNLDDAQTCVNDFRNNSQDWQFA